MKNPLTAFLSFIAISAITVLEIVAIANDLNGTILAGSLALIAGLGGYTVGKSLKSK